jgi:hypothetical protein
MFSAFSGSPRAARTSGGPVRNPLVLMAMKAGGLSFVWRRYCVASSAVREGWIIWESWPPGYGYVNFVLGASNEGRERSDSREGKKLGPDAAKERTRTTPEPNDPDHDPPMHEIQFLFPDGVFPTGMSGFNATDIRKSNSSCGAGSESPGYGKKTGSCASGRDVL